MKKPFVFNYEDRAKICEMDFPDECPVCHQVIDVHSIGYKFDVDTDELDVLFQCPNPRCQGYYHVDYSYNPAENTSRFLGIRISGK